MMTLPPEVLAAIRAQARRDHYPDPQRWQAVLGTVRVMKRDMERPAQADKGDQ